MLVEFFIRILIRESNDQNQDIAKSWKNLFFNYFLIGILIWKSNHQNQENAKSSKGHISNYCWIIFLYKKQQPKPRYCQKLEKHIFQLLFYWNFN